MDKINPSQAMEELTLKRQTVFPTRKIIMHGRDMHLKF